MFSFCVVITEKMGLNFTLINSFYTTYKTQYQNIK